MASGRILCFFIFPQKVERDVVPLYNEINSGCFCRFACMDQGPVQVTVTGRILPFKSCSDSTKTSLLVGVRPRQRFFTFSSNSTSTICPRYFLLISATTLSC